MPESFYSREGEFWFPGTACTSPWNKHHQSGVAIAGLLAHHVDVQPAPQPMQLCRLSVDILRPVPMEPALVTCTTLRDGAKVQLVEARISVGGITCALAVGLKVRVGESPQVPLVPISRIDVDLAPDRPLVRKERDRAGLEFRIVQGGLTERGPGKSWIRSRLDLAEGVPVSPVATSAMVADTGSAIGTIFDSREWSFANMDLCMHFIRPPRSAWQYIESATQSAGKGQAVVSAQIYDDDGLFAHSHQTLFVSGYAKQKSTSLETQAQK